MGQATLETREYVPERNAPLDWWASERENVYAHRKRLCFLLRAIEELRARTAKAPADLHILDVGCGTGIMITLPMASLGYRITGIDIDGSSINTAREINPYANALFRHADAADLLAAGERYDAIIAAEVLEHLADPLTFLQILRGLLTPRGILILTTPNGYGWFELEQFLWDGLGLGRPILRCHELWTAFLERAKAIIKRAMGRQHEPSPSPAPWEHLLSTENTESPHLQRFCWTRLARLLDTAALTIVGMGKGSLLCGRITHTWLRSRRSFIALNSWAADRLPRAIVADWYIVCTPGAPPPRILCLADSGLVAQATASIEADFGTPPSLLVSFRQLRGDPVLALRLLLQRFDLAIAYLPDVEVPLYRDCIVAYLFALRAGWRSLRDIRGREIAVKAHQGLRAFLGCLTDLAGFPLMYGHARWKAWQLALGRPRQHPPRPLLRRAAYLRAHMWQESQAGGSVAHTAGVLSGLKEAGFEVSYIGTSQFPPAARLGVRVNVVPPRFRWFRNIPDAPFLVYSDLFERECRAILADQPPDFVYQRYSLLNSSGLRVAGHLRCPFVLEYNGSEIWVARHWSNPLVFEGLADRIERASLRRAHLVVVVSRALQDEVVGKGVLPERVLVNPNGVDPARYNPGIDGGAIRRRLDLAEKIVVGFIGTFGPWHGAEMLAQAVRLVAVHLPEAHFLFIGDGSGMPRVQEIIARDGVQGRVSLVGLIPQDEAPNYLAACDILVSPHVPNPDGTPFFGSPTKLFEYMAMGRGIVASDLDQIGEVLSHGKTAWLVKPGDPDALAEGIMTLATDPELRRALGEAAREEVVAKHTWTAHVERLLTKMVELNLLDPGVLHPPAAR